MSCWLVILCGIALLSETLVLRFVESSCGNLVFFSWLWGIGWVVLVVVVVGFDEFVGFFHIYFWGLRTAEDGWGCFGLVSLEWMVLIRFVVGSVLACETLVSACRCFWGDLRGFGCWLFVAEEDINDVVVLTVLVDLLGLKPISVFACRIIGWMGSSPVGLHGLSFHACSQFPG